MRIFSKEIREIASEEIEFIKTFFDLAQEYEDNGFVFVSSLVLHFGSGSRSIFPNDVNISIDRYGRFTNNYDENPRDRFSLYSLPTGLTFIDVMFELKRGPMNVRLMDTIEDMEIKMLEFYPEFHKKIGYRSNILCYYFPKNQ